LFYAFQGKAELAYQYALEGTRRGEEMSSPFVTAVGYMRQGHALMLLGGKSNQEHAREQFEKAIQISQEISVPRLRVEAHWGLCRGYGYAGEIEQALSHAEQGIEIAEQAGDEWVASLVRLAMGAALVLAARYESAAGWLNQAVRGFEACSDTFVATGARLWLALLLYHQNDVGQLAHLLPVVLRSCRERSYEFLFTQQSLIGVPDPRALIPLLILASQQAWEAEFASALLDEIGLPGISLHPGYQLRVFTLGKFQVWRGNQPIPPHGWRREKSRQLFQLFVTFQDNPLDRDQILNYLWPELEPAAAQRNFKVTLSNLFAILEPDRTPGSESAYIMRQRSIYGIRPGTDLWCDSQEFLSLIANAAAVGEDNPDEYAQLLEQALGLYSGDYLPDARYETWAAGQREHLAVLYLQASDTLCNIYLRNSAYHEVLERCQQILTHDNCWERAYRYQMRAYHGLGDCGQIARAYQRCIDTLKTELDVSPAIETVQLFRDLACRDAPL
jgi:DNA-binding SARP family transcriptional activator